METQTSPLPIQGKAIFHLSHPQHPLVQVRCPSIFTCMVCKEYGAGERFKCQNCNFEIHDFCASAPSSIQSHPFHNQHQLVFYTKPGGFLSPPRCDVCGKGTRGYTFRCSTHACNFEMHPCCAMLSQEMDFPVHPHTLHLSSTTTTTTSGEPGFVCGECKKKRLGRVYHCKDCDYHLHAFCAKEMVNGLHANGKKTPEKPSMMGAAARIASHVILGFIGGIAEGIGEGFGEAIVETIGRGNPNREEEQDKRANTVGV